MIRLTAYIGTAEIGIIAVQGLCTLLLARHGYSTDTVDGAWTDDDGNIIAETSLRVITYCDDDTAADTVAAALTDIGRAAGQTCILLERVAVRAEFIGTR